MGQIFISYSRRDKVFVQRLNDALKARERETWVDWEGIAPSAEWLKEIYTAIEAADAVIFVITPDSVASEVCGQEIAHAIACNKRLVPLVYRDVEPQLVNSVLAAHNWIFAREDQDDFEEALDKVLFAVDTDLEWVRAHTRLLTRALEWKASGQDTSLALSGRELYREESRLTHSAGKKPALTPLQIEYILASRRHTSRRQRILAGVGIFLAFALMTLGLMVYDNRARARLYQSRDFHAKAVWALADNNVLYAEVLLAKSLTLDDRKDTRERYLEARVRGTRLRWMSSPAPERRPLTASVDGYYVVSLEPQGALALWDVAEQRSTPTVLAAQSGTVTCAAFRSTSDMLATGYENGEIRLWDPRSGKLRRTIPAGHASDGGVLALAFSPDGRTIAAAVATHDIRLIEVDTAKTLRTLTGGPSERISCIAFRPDGAELAAGSDDHDIYLFDAVGNKGLLHRLQGHEDGILSLCYSPDSRYLASGSWDTNIHIWDAESGQRLRILSGHQSGIVSLAFTSDTTRLVSGSQYGIVRLWAVETGRNLQTIQAHPEDVSCLAYAKGDTLLVTGGKNDGLRVWDMADVDNKPEVHTYRDHQGLAVVVAFSPDGRLVASGSEDTTVHLRDPITGKLMHVLSGHTKGVWSISFRPDGKVVATGSRDTTVRLWDVATGRLLRTIAHPNAVRSTAFSPDGAYLVTGTDDGMIRLWDAKTGRLTGTLSSNAATVGPNETPDQSSAISLEFGGKNSNLLAVGRVSGKIQFFDFKTRKQLGADVPAHRDGVWGLTLDPEGKYIASCGQDGIAKVWDTSSHLLVEKLVGHKGGIWDIAWSPNGKRIATSGQDATVRLWDVTRKGNDVEAAAEGESVDGTTKNAITLRGYVSAVWSVAFSPDGRRLASSSQDHTVRIWDLPRLNALLSAEPAHLLEESERDTGLLVTDDEVVSMPADRFARTTAAASNAHMH